MESLTDLRSLSQVIAPDGEIYVVIETLEGQAKVRPLRGDMCREPVFAIYELIAVEGSDV